MVISVLLYECTIWTLTKRMEERLDGNYTRMLWAILNKSWRNHPTKQQLYGHLPPISKTIQVRRSRHSRIWWRSRNKLISDILPWTPSHGQAKAGQPAWNYIPVQGVALKNYVERMTIEKGVLVFLLLKLRKQTFAWCPRFPQVVYRGAPAHHDTQTFCLGSTLN